MTTATKTYLKPDFFSLQTGKSDRLLGFLSSENFLSPLLFITVLFAFLAPIGEVRFLQHKRYRT